jgi:hypothetical protein
VVHHSAQAIDRFLEGSRRAGRAPALLAILAAVAFIAAGCGGGTNTQPQVDVGPNVGQPIALADCHDWQQANVEQRLGTIQQIKDFAGGPVVGNNASSPSGRGPVLDDKQAYNLFNGWCSQSYASGFKLYHLYQRAAAFANVPQQ